ncbi:MAG: tetratricopeptide repeat protein [Akkermansiaceae bacterium]|nr:tetratricopeptide repeat protein [Akkermansiaceae bacterium]
MLHRLTILILILTLPTIAAPRGSGLPGSVAKELGKAPAYQEGVQAMEDQLHDIAVTKFRAALEDKKISSASKPYLTLALIEALVRSSASPHGDLKQAEEALKLIEEKTIKDLNSAPIWKAEALASLGRYQDADKSLSEIPPTHPLSGEILLARARILLALDRSNEALGILVKLGQSKASKISNEANLLAAEIHIDQSRYDTAQKMLEKIDGQDAETARLKEYLGARITLAEGNSAEATNRFQSLITAPDNLTERIFHACILGKADAQVANKQSEAAIATLEQFISDYPESSAIQEAFIRLSALLPENLADDAPSMVKLRQWSSETPLPEDVLYIGGDSNAAIHPLMPSSNEHADRVSLALYHRALLLARTKDQDKHDQAMALLRRLRSQHSDSPKPPSELYFKLASASLLDTAYLHLKQNHPEQATYTLSVMEKVAFSPRLKDQASYIRGLLLAREGKLDIALEAFNYARESTSEDIAHAAKVNAGIVALKATNLIAFEKILQSSAQANVRTALLLERALWKCSQEDATGRSELESFIVTHPNHPRENEARLALAAASVNISPPDVMLATAQLEIISPRLSDAASQLTITRILIRAEELSLNWTAAAAAAERFITTFKDDPNIPSLQLRRGEAYYHNEDYNKARLIFNDITTKYPDSPFSPYASFFAAMSARLGGTAQAREECITMFQKIIDSNHELSAESRIQQSRVLIDLRRYTEAETSLKPLLDPKKTPAPLCRAAGVLMADCLHRQGAADSAKYEEAIKIYNELLAAENLPLAWENRLHFLRGQTYESMSKVSDAFGSYYDVVIRGNIPTAGKANKEEWLWFYRCGFKALAMLESDKRWEAAVKLARRIASFNGPRAEEAAKRANSLAKKHMIWEDVDPEPIEPDPITGNKDKAAPASE